VNIIEGCRAIQSGQRKDRFVDLRPDNLRARRRRKYQQEQE
jgi:hypothetical protein